jgi:hypothetical protein
MKTPDTAMRAAHPKIVLMLGSAPDAVRSREWQRAPFHEIVAINNAWQVRNDWDHLVHAGDFPIDAMPEQALIEARHVHTADDYVPAQNAYGGFVYAGGTMSMTASYWALHTLKPDIIGYLGCDMVYGNTGPTHFYGTGSPDPLRADVTLQSLEAKTTRLQILAARQGCLCINLSSLETSRLTFPRVDIDELSGWDMTDVQSGLEGLHRRIDKAQLEKAELMEAALGYFVANGKYWQHLDRFDAGKLLALDRLWLEALAQVL